MDPWPWLIFTIIFAGLTYAASRASKDVNTISWTDGLSHLSAADKRKRQQRYETVVRTKPFVLLLALTFVFAVGTVRAFFPAL